MFFYYILSTWHSHFGIKLPHASVHSASSFVGKGPQASSGQQETGARKRQQRPSTQWAAIVRMCPGGEGK